MAKANLQAFKGILLGDIPVPSENIETRIQKDEIAREYNMYAYSSLILCCTGVPFSIVDGAKTVELPSEWRCKTYLGGPKRALSS